MNRFVRLAGAIGIAAAITGISSATLGGASSHREAPSISQDPTADATDLYAFRSPDAPDTITFIANYVPLQSPTAGPNFYKFGDNVLYEVNIDNNGDAIEDITFQFRFRSDVNPANAFNGNTFLYNTGAVASLADANLNQRQFFSVSKLTGEGGSVRAGTLILEASVVVWALSYFPRMPEPEVDWRFALITSSMSAFPRACSTPLAFRRASPDQPGPYANGVKHGT